MTILALYVKYNFAAPLGRSKTFIWFFSIIKKVQGVTLAMMHLFAPTFLYVVYQEKGSDKM